MNPIPIKSALAILGYITDELRAPLTIATPETKEQIYKTMKKYGIKEMSLQMAINALQPLASDHIWVLKATKPMVLKITLPIIKQIKMAIPLLLLKTIPLLTKAQ